MKPSPAGRHLRRWLGILRRLARGAPPPYRPDFSDGRLLHLLAPQSGADPTRRTLDAALAARQLLGPRFFVSPAAIPALWHRLEHDHPHWHRRLVERNAADATTGIPLYERTGPALGADFPWSGLATDGHDDLLYPIRPHRFAFAPRAALACLYDADATVRLRGTLQAWSEAAASGTNPHCYVTNLVVIQRVLALSWCWAFLAARPAAAGADGAGLELLVLRILHADVEYLEPRLAHSAPNNHLLVDRFAAWYLRTVFPELLGRPAQDDEARWRDELLRQTYPDGGSFEHSTHYHEFACEMGAAYLLLCRRARRAPDPVLERRIGALLRFQLALTGRTAAPLPIGNGIEDPLFPLDPDEGWCPAALGELHRALFPAETATPPNNDPSAMRAFWLLGGELAMSTAAPPADERAHFLPDSGLGVLADARRDARLVFRTGPSPGRRVAAGHAHADLLGVYVDAGGQPIVVDAGTCTYRLAADAGTQPAWRAYFAGPAAHNGLTITGDDPLGALTADFRPFDTAARVAGRCLTGRQLDLIEARLTGLTRYAGTGRACVHLRGAYWLIFDSPAATVAGADDAWYGFQCAPGTRVTVSGRSAVLTPARGGAALALLASDGLALPTVLEGSIDPPGGWVSPRYGCRVAAPQLRFRLDAAASPSAFLLTTAEPAAAPLELELIALDHGALAARVRHAEHVDHFLFGGHDESPRAASWGDLTFEGRLLWLRLHEDRPLALEWLDGHRLTWPTHALDIGPHQAGHMARDFTRPSTQAETKAQSSS